MAFKDFFNDSRAEMWLRFAHSQASIFHSAVSQIEGQNTSMTEVSSALHDQKKKLTDSGVAREGRRGRAAPGGTPEGAAFSDNHILILSISLQQWAPGPHNCCTSKHKGGRMLTDATELNRTERDGSVQFSCIADTSIDMRCPATV